ncbi:hypothetical protein NLJ89_g1401 [Agrocybe chaxingu]|uniref:VLRF1 domain-containing protein n=1 Tax=Agrocybe chaxingu TaxID=84603 RepID=A0A9W8N045_9AGAR|nr:hypothetical protein NLJ89_g1401 [Agrocybe chaxingu]
MQSSHYNLFSLPPELLASLTPRNLVNKAPIRAPTPEPVEPVSKSGPRACNVCQGVVFLDVDQQRVHFKSDWHRYNVKTRLNGGKPVTETAFAQLVDGLDDSLSGSASSDGDDEDSDAVNTLLDKAKRLTTRSPSPESSSKIAPLTALTWFHSPPAMQIGIYRAVLPLNAGSGEYLHELRRLQSSMPDGRKWAMFMVAGGHFAGAVVRVSRSEDEPEHEPESGQKRKAKKFKPDTEVLLHKTFHRYTTRRKQGGSQSTNDNAKGPAKSAGALLRRYGEQALRDDIRNLLGEWADEIASCERIWIRASISNRRIFYDYDDAVFLKNDERLRTFPFPTRRPTQSELNRCLLELVRPKISHFTEEELKFQDEAYLASLPKPKPVPTVQPVAVTEKPKPPKLAREEEALRDKWNRLLEMVYKGRLEPLKMFLDRESSTIGGINVLVPEWTGERRATILQIAVQSGHEDIIKWLLEEAKADPTIPVPSAKLGDIDEDDEGPKSDASDAARPAKGSWRAAYDLAKTKAIRDIFRRCAAAHPDWWDWFGTARVPSALSQEMEEGREEKKKVRRKGLKDRVKEREAKDREKEKEQPITPPAVVTPEVKEVSNTTAQRLGGASGAGDGVAGLTPEMRAKVERERRARAAEARLKGLAGAG